jgi:hypothetical protein
MGAINSYATLAEFKDWIRMGGTTVSADSTDDTIIQRVLGSASRKIDNEARRTFYPRVQTRQFDVPENGHRGLILDDDLLEVITLTNGDDNTIDATEYNLIPKNDPPYFEIRLKEASTTYWEDDSSGNSELVIDLLGFWGFHEEYADRAWINGSTINEGDTLSAADTTITVVSGALHKIDELIKIENELMRITNIVSNDLTVIRGENGSTAATHADTTQIEIWEPMEDIREACLMVANNFFRKRTGKNVASVATVTAAGVVITPQDIPGDAMRIIKDHTRGGWG